MKEWGVYIIETESNTLYTGCTNDLKARWRAHEAGNGAKYLKAHKPVRVVYWESVGSRSQALKREAQIKKMSRKRKLQLF